MTCQITGPIKMTNYCYLYQPEVITNYCDYTSGSSARLAAGCATASTAGEWIPAYFGSDGCSFQNSNPGQMVNPSDSCSSVIGSYGLCSRTSYTGDPFTCCLNSLDCYSPGTLEDPDTPALCYSDPGKNNTCHPDYRQLTNPKCLDIVGAVCGGTTGTTQQWLDGWLRPENSCADMITRSIFRNYGNGCPQSIPKVTVAECGQNLPFMYDAQGYYWALDVMTNAFNKANSLGYNIGTVPGDVGYSAWQDIVYSKVCCLFPGLCQEGLNSACRSRSLQSLSYNPRAAEFCGCHLDPVQYLDYSSNYNIPPECTPLCNRIGSVPKTDIIGQAVRCKQDVCLIDNITLNLVNSTVGGGVNFSQFCNKCPSGSCTCIASNDVIDIFDSSIGGNADIIKQNCGSFSRQQTNPGTIGPNTIPVPNANTDIYNPFESYDQKQRKAKEEQYKGFWLWAILILAVLLVIIFFVLLRINKYPEYYPASNFPAIPKLAPIPPYQPPKVFHTVKYRTVD